MNSDVDWDLLGKYLLGECSEEEVARVQAWIEEDPARETLLEELRQVLRMTRDPGSPGAWDTTALWDRIQQRTRQQGASSKPAGERSAHAPDRTSREGHVRRRPARSRAGLSFFMRRATWVGAIALMVVAMVTFWLHGSVDGGLWTQSASETNIFATQKGQWASVRLSDGTRVQLNVDSRLTVPAVFGEERRAVRIEGEAFFDVTEDSTRPFVVRAGDAVTQVLGTAFNVNAYPEDDETQVVVTEGRVALRADDPSRADESSAVRDGANDVVLTKQQMGWVLHGGRQVAHRMLEANHQHLAWMDGRLVFEKAPFNEVIQKLERWYRLTISLEDGVEAPSERLNAQFAEDRPLHEVLDVVATAYGLEYERHEQRIVLTRAEAETARLP